MPNNIDERIEKIKDTIKNNVKEWFGDDISDAKVHYSTKSFVYDFSDDYIIKVDEISKDESQFVALLEYLVELKKNCSEICVPVRTLSGKVYEKVELEDRVLAVTKFEKAKGKLLRGNMLNAGHAYVAGDVLGKIHEYSIQLNKDDRTIIRPSFEDEIKSIEAILDEDFVMQYYDEKAINQIRALLENVKGIEKTQKNFGLIHNDFTFYNYFVEDNKISVFDFGDCGYGYFMYDIAILFLSWISKPDANAMLDVNGNLELLMPAFREAYEKHVSVAENDWDNLKIFMQLRQIKSATKLIMSNHTKNNMVIGGTVEEGIVRKQVALSIGDIYEQLDQSLLQTRDNIMLIAKMLKEGKCDESNPKEVYLWNVIHSDESRPFYEYILEEIESAKQ
ncbi:MAG: phosphotransferase [Lachnospiraceae bacterium]|nr:phosphotransferase [Candidatus Colinaster equi]